MYISLSLNKSFWLNQLLSFNLTKFEYDNPSLYIDEIFPLVPIAKSAEHCWDIFSLPSSLSKLTTCENHIRYIERKDKYVKIKRKELVERCRSFDVRGSLFRIPIGRRTLDPNRITIYGWRGEMKIQNSSSVQNKLNYSKTFESIWNESNKKVWSSVLWITLKLK